MSNNDSITKTEKIIIAVGSIIIGLILLTAFFIFKDKINVQGIINSTIQTIKASGTDKATKLKHEVANFKYEMGESLLNKEKAQSILSFELNESKLSKDNIQKLQKIINFSKTHPIYTVSILGYTDKSGTDAINIPLSIARTTAVKNYLLASGISNIQSIGFGSSKDTRIVDVTIIAK
jgi:outer membrane protein OmpA-like peptidoglycan-associated protein